MLQGRVRLGSWLTQGLLPAAYPDSSLTACSGVESAAAPQKLLILDARSYTAAVANRAKGGGCECEGTAVIPVSSQSARVALVKRGRGQLGWWGEPDKPGLESGCCHFHLLAMTVIKLLSLSDFIFLSVKWG